jgi:hypothetical protein
LCIFPKKPLPETAQQPPNSKSECIPRTSSSTFGKQVKLQMLLYFRLTFHR